MNEHITEDGLYANVYYDHIYILTGYAWCWACGRDDRQPPRDWCAPFGIDRAHLGHGSGVMRREEDRRAVNLLCRRCHTLHSPLQEMKLSGQIWKTISLPNMLWLKERYDPEWYDVDYLSSTIIGPVPEPEPLDGKYDDEYHRHRGPRPKIPQEVPGLSGEMGGDSLV